MGRATLLLALVAGTLAGAGCGAPAAPLESAQSTQAAQQAASAWTPEQKAKVKQVMENDPEMAARRKDPK